jgi:L-lactate dehydrogenase
VDGGDDIEICRDADVVVLAAGAKQAPGQSRLDLAASNVALCRDLVPRLVAVAPAALLLVVSNPVDVLTWAVLRLSDLPAGRVFGSGTVLDSARLRQLLAHRCGVAVPNVHAFVAGEHGDSEIALWSSATIAGVPLRSWAGAGGGRLDEGDLEEVLDEVRGAADRIIAGKGATNFAIGVAGARILEAIERDERRVLTVSALTDAGHGLHDVCLSVPRIVDRSGVVGTVEVALDEAESEGLRRSAEAIREVARSLGIAGS